MLAVGLTQAQRMTYEQTVTDSKMKMTQVTPSSITCPDEVITPAETFNLFDGVPTRETAEDLFDYVDRARGVQAYIRMIGTVNMARFETGWTRCIVGF